MPAWKADLNGKSQSATITAKRPSVNSIQHQSWSSVSKELDMCHNQSHGDTQNYRNGASVTYYQEREPNPELKDFQPFNLEAWWGQRVVQSITRNTNS